MVFISWSKERGNLILQKYLAKIIIVVNYFHKALHHKCLAVFWICLGFWIYQRSEYTRVRGFWVYQDCEYAGFWTCFWFWICEDSGYTKVLNMHGTINTNSNINSFMKYAKLHRVLIMAEYAWIILGYAWLCLNVPKYVWMALVIHLAIVISYL